MSAERADVRLGVDAGDLRQTVRPTAWVALEELIANSTRGAELRVRLTRAVSDGII